ncbi:MAG: PadR family transcriptional regulator [Micromonosporaceae bacterium]
MTLQTKLVLKAFLAEPGREMYGLELCETTELPSGTVYPLLARLEGAGWVESQWEEPGEHVAQGRPRRRYYRLTRDGAVRAAAAVKPAERARRRPAPFPRTTGA